MTRRNLLAALAVASPLLRGQSQPPGQPTPEPEPLDWQCPMDPDVHMASAGKCPRCGMTLVLSIPARSEYSLALQVEPSFLKPGDPISLTLRPLDERGMPASHFELVHEKLIHLFVVSENLEFFEHIHPVLGADQAFHIQTRLTDPGMYRLLADYYPGGSVPQLSLATLFVDGPPHTRHLQPAVAPQQGSTLKVALRTEPEQPTSGLLCRLFFDLDPNEGLELYLGAWAHMLIASEDLVDMIHTHPFLANSATVQFNVLFPRPGLHRIWVQFQRRGVVNTAVFTLPVREL